MIAAPGENAGSEVEDGFTDQSEGTDPQRQNLPIKTEPRKQPSLASC